MKYWVITIILLGFFYNIGIIGFLNVIIKGNLYTFLLSLLPFGRIADLCHDYYFFLISMPLIIIFISYLLIFYFKKFNYISAVAYIALNILLCHFFFSPKNSYFPKLAIESYKIAITHFPLILLFFAYKCHQIMSIENSIFADSNKDV